MSDTENKQEQAATGGVEKHFWLDLQWIQIATVLLVAIGLAMYIRAPYESLQAEIPKMTVIDMDALVRAAAAGAASKGGGKVNVIADAEAFSKAAKVEVARFTNAGYGVVNPGHLVGWPEDMDRTQEFANRLGVDLRLANLEEKERGSRIQQLLKQSAGTKP